VKDFRRFVFVQKVEDGRGLGTQCLATS